MNDQKAKMDPGEKELRQIFEKTTISNIKAIISYNEQTQQTVKRLEEKVNNLDGVIRQYDTQIEGFKNQLAVLQTKIFQGGS